VRVRAADGLELEVEVRGARRGDTTPALLVHGFGGAAASWGEGVLEGLGEGRPVLALDLLGHGRSDDPPAAERVALEPVLDDLERVLDAAGADACDWVGYSMGGRIALAAALLRPGRVRRLVLESASPGLATPLQRRARRAHDEALARRIERRGVDAWIEEWEDGPLFERRRRLPPEVREPFMTLRRANRAPALAAWLRGLGTGSQPSFRERLHELRIPVLLMTGAEDERFTEIAREMAAEMPSARHVVVPGAGHTVHLEEQGAWLGAVRAFLDEQPARTRSS
jgi:2-succinyl-6-hydroxy-2,4-cyclohexadiene-1-carboxylate synthase